MRIAISGEVPAKGYDLNEFLWIVRSLDVSAIEIWPENIPYPDGTNPYTRSYEDRDIDYAASLLEKYGITIACVSFGGAFDRRFTDDPAFYAKELTLAVRTAARLGAGFVNSYLYHLSMDKDPDIDRLSAIYAPAIEEAARLGVIILLENEAHDSTRDPYVMRSIIKSIDSPNFRVNFDAVNYYQSSYECFPYSFEILKDCFSYIHIKDGCIYNADDISQNPRCVGGEMSGANKGSIYYPIMGNGVFNIPAEIRALKAIGYDGWCTLEPHVPIDLWGLYITKEVSYLKNLGLE